MRKRSAGGTALIAVKRSAGRGPLPDVVRIEPDGTAVEFAGALMVDLETGETILEPRDRSDEQVARACGALTRG